MIRLILFIAFAFLLEKSLAQQAAPLSFSYEPATSSEIKQRGSIQMAFPLIRSEHNHLIVSPQYRFLQTDDSLPFEETKFAQTSLRLIWQHELNDRWNAVLILSPSLASTFRNYSSEALMWSGAIRMSYRANQRFLYYFGIAYSNRFSNNLLVPVAGLKWNPVSRMNLLLKLPSRIRLSWEFTNLLHTGLQLAGSGQMSYVPNQPEYDYFWFRERNLSWFTDLKLIRNWWVTAELGCSLKRDLLAYQRPDQSVWRFGTQFESTSLDPVFEYSEKGFFLNVSLDYRLGK